MYNITVCFRRALYNYRVALLCNYTFSTYNCRSVARYSFLYVPHVIYDLFFTKKIPLKLILFFNYFICHSNNLFLLLFPEFPPKKNRTLNYS